MKLAHRTLAPLAALVALSAAPAAHAVRGLVVDDIGQASIIDTTTSTILASLPFSPSGSDGDCAIMGNGSLGFLTTFTTSNFVVNMNTLSMAGPPNPMVLSGIGEDVALTPNNQFGVICDGSNTQPILAFSTATRLQTSTLSITTDCNSVDTCDDGSALATSFSQDRVNRLFISPAGILSASGNPPVTGLIDPNNVTCAPTSRCGVVVEREQARVKSFAVPLTGGIISNVALGGFGISAEFNPAGTMLWTRDNVRVTAYTFDPATCVIGAQLYTIPISATPTYFGMDQMALSPTDNKLVVSQPGQVRVYNALSGSLTATITGFSTPTGVCFPKGAVGGNLPPVADAGGPYVEECNGNPSTVQLDGSASSDPNNDPLTYQWTTTCAGATFSSATVVSPVLSVPDSGCQLDCTVTLTVSDGQASSSDTANVTIQDTTGPVLSTGGIPGILACLWPPNHKYVCFTGADFPGVNAVDECDNGSTIVFTSCTSDQPDNEGGDGNTVNDCVVSADGLTVCARAERTGHDQAGRHYTISAAGTDSCGNTGAPGPLGVLYVPHDGGCR